jgi:hypothetical protein
MSRTHGHDLRRYDGHKLHLAQLARHKALQAPDEEELAMKVIKITCHTRIDEPGESWEVSDDGGEFDDESFALYASASDEVQARHDHYIAANPLVSIKIRNT